MSINSWVWKKSPTVEPDNRVVSLQGFSLRRIKDSTQHRLQRLQGTLLHYILVVFMCVCVFYCESIPVEAKGVD